LIALELVDDHVGLRPSELDLRDRLEREMSYAKRDLRDGKRARHAEDDADGGND